MMWLFGPVAPLLRFCAGRKDQRITWLREGNAYAPLKEACLCMVARPWLTLAGSTWIMDTLGKFRLKTSADSIYRRALRDLALSTARFGCFLSLVHLLTSNGQLCCNPIISGKLNADRVPYPCKFRETRRNASLSFDSSFDSDQPEQRLFIAAS